MADHGYYGYMGDIIKSQHDYSSQKKTTAPLSNERAIREKKQVSTFKHLVCDYYNEIYDWTRL